MRIQKKILNKLYFVLGPLVRRYLSKVRTHNYRGIKVIVLPSVFHPGLFFSSKILIRFLELNFDFRNKTILDLGAGSGLISIYCAKNGAAVTCSDINDVAIEGLRENAALNNVRLQIIKSDLFADIPNQNFDLIIINPPYYPKAVQTVHDLAWYCGENFEYFRKLFDQLSKVLNTRNPRPRVVMILSEDCRISEIRSIAAAHGVTLDLVYSKVVWGEENYVFDLFIGNR